VLIGACSSGLASNVMSYIAEANLPLSITLTAIGTVTAPFTTPFWMWLLIGDSMNFDGVEFIKMTLNIVKLVVVPIGAALLHDYLKHARPLNRGIVLLLAAVSLAGLVVLMQGGWSFLEQRYSDGALAGVTIVGFIGGALVAGVAFHYLCRLLPTLERSMPVGSMIGILYVTLMTTAAGRDALIGIGPRLFVVSILHNAVGLALGYWICRLTRVDERSSRTISLEVGIQNGGMASGLASEMNKLGTVGLAAAVFIPWMNIAGSLLANYWRRKPPPDVVPINV
jgi:bile acid:Na+ symporter, BASS family